MIRKIQLETRHRPSCDVTVVFSTLVKERTILLPYHSVIS